MTDQAKPTCEFIMQWGNASRPTIYCGTPATQRYPTVGRNFMHMCDEHSIPHLNYTQPVPAGGKTK